jgi:hypothetical protein
VATAAVPTMRMRVTVRQTAIPCAATSAVKVMNLQRVELTAPVVRTACVRTMKTA